MPVQGYQHARVKGLAPWKPHRPSLALVEQIRGVLTEYADHLPLTARQIFYRLVGAHDYPKSEKAYNRLAYVLGRARRGGYLPFDAFRDDGVTARDPGGFSGMAQFWTAVHTAAESYRRDRMCAQPQVVEVWVEAAGMVPQAVRVAHEYGAAVYSSGGFNSLTALHDAAQRIRRRYIRHEQDTVVLQIGDHDPSGESIFASAALDVETLVRDIEWSRTPPGLCVDLPGLEFARVAVTEEQIQRYQLPTAPPKKSDKRGDWTGGTVQAEALPPDVLADVLRAAIERRVDLDQHRNTLDLEHGERTLLTERAAELGEDD